MEYALDFAPYLSPLTLWVLGILCVLVALLNLWRRPLPGLARTFALGLLFLALLNPQLKREQRDRLDNIALVVVDHSDSQKITHRMKTTLELEKQLRQRLGKIANLEIRTIKSGNNTNTQDHGTKLIADMNNGLADIPRDRLAGIFLITDGQIHDIPKKPEILGLDVPLHALITGRRDDFDRRIKLIEAPRFGLVDTTRQIRLEVQETGQNKAASPLAQLTIRRENKPDRTIGVRIGEEITIDFDFPHAGQNIFEVELAGVPDELTLANNRLVLSAQGVRENLRVLLVSGEPHPGERTWRNLLRSDAAVDLVHFTILRPPEKQDGTPINQLSLIAFPTRELFSERLSDFDLIIFDRYRRRGVLPLIYLDNVARYVEAGGAVLIAAGAQFAKRRSLARTPLAQVLPADPTGAITVQPFKARISKNGRRHPVTRALPGAALEGGTGEPSWGKWFRLIDARARSGDVLMTGPDEKPLLLLDRRGKGRVAMMLSDHAWLWARGYDGGGPYNALFRRLSHWLMKEPDLEEEFLTAHAKGRTLTIERRSMGETVPPVELTSPTGKKSLITLEKTSPGIWRKKIKAPVGGLYRLSSGEMTSAIHIGRINSREFSSVTASRKLLAPLIKTTGGTALWQGKATEKTADKTQQTALPRILMAGKGRQMFGPGWLALADRKAYHVRSAQLIPLFSGLLALALLLGALSFTWLREGR